MKVVCPYLPVITQLPYVHAYLSLYKKGVQHFHFSSVPVRDPSREEEFITAPLN
jgi:hypothetical protein